MEAVATTNFLVNTYNMVSSESTNSCVKWSIDGKTVCIKDVAVFAHSALPLYFRHSRHCSFVRQLNNYGFSRSVVGNIEYFAHPGFLRDHPHLLSTIQRKTSYTSMTVAKAGIRQHNNMVEETNIHSQRVPVVSVHVPPTKPPTFDEYVAAETAYAEFRQVFGMTRDEFVHERLLDDFVAGWKRAADVLRTMDSEYARAAVPAKRHVPDNE